MNGVLEKGRLSRAQEVLANHAARVAELRKPPLGPEFKVLSGSDLADALVAHRTTNKFELPADTNSALRKDRSIRAMLAYDQTAPEMDTLFDVPAEHRKTFCLAKTWLQETLKSMKTSHRFRPPSGETHVSSKGSVDLFFKLRDAEQWTVSWDCLKPAASLAYNNLYLRRLVKARFWHTDYAKEFAQSWYEEAVLAGVRPGFYCFHRMFAKLVDIVGTSRLTTVPKDNSSDRVITCEPLWNMIVQLSISADLKDALFASRGYDLDSRQLLHHTLIRHDNKVTIDLKNASNSNWLGPFKLLFPPKVVERVLAARTGIVEFEDEYHPLNMLAPMGCGYTFEIMTLTLLSYARVFDPGATVFGDDVILEQKSAPAFIRFVSAMGWQLNDQKSFIDGNFRESCGGFYDLTTDTALVSYDVHYPETFYDVLVIANKMYRILVANQIGWELRRLVLQVYVDLILIIPDVLYRYETVDVEKLPDGVVLVPTNIPLGSFKPTVFNEELRKYFHREVIVQRKLKNTSVIKIPRKLNGVSLTMAAAYFQRGASYDVPIRKTKLSYETCVGSAGVPISGIPLMSFI